MSSPRPAWIRPVSSGVELELLVQPRASRTRVVGEHDGRLKLQLAAPPVDGEANEALAEFLSAALRVPRRQLVLLRGESGRRKTVLARDTSPEAVAVALAPAPGSAT